MPPPLVRGPWRLTALVEDSAHERGLKGEHGLSLLVEGPSGDALFDVGQTGLFLENARFLGRDLSGVSEVVLSHGHYDHGDGLPALARHVAPRPLVVRAHPAALERKLARKGAHLEDIGLSWRPEELVQGGWAPTLTAEAGPLPWGGWLTDRIPRRPGARHHAIGFVGTPPEDLAADPLDDDRALVLPTDRGLVVLLGCAHAGLVNSLEAARELLGEERIHAVVGGFHLLAAEADEVAESISALRALGVARVAAGHCTGLRAQAALLDAFPGRAPRLATGVSLTFGGDA